MGSGDDDVFHTSSARVWEIDVSPKHRRRRRREEEEEEGEEEEEEREGERA